MYFYLTVRLVQIWSLNLHGENLRVSERNGETQTFQLKNFNILPKVIIKRKDKHFGELTKIHTPRDFFFDKNGRFWNKKSRFRQFEN